MDCGICIQNFSDVPEKEKYFTLCSHSFCKDCFEEWEKVCINDNKDVICPMCRYILQKAITKDNDIEMNLIQDEDSEDFREYEDDEIQEIEEMEWVENEISYLESMNNVSEEDYNYIQNQRYEREFYGRVYTY